MRRWQGNRRKNVHRQHNSDRNRRGPKGVGMEVIKDEGSEETPSFRPDKVRKVREKVSLGYVETGVIIDRVVEGVVDKVT